MLDRPEEYQSMAAVESNHWWFRTLHETCLMAICAESSGMDLRILDAGCGTGGLMAYLKAHGYKNVSGFDLADVAVQKCLSDGLDVWQQDITKLEAFPAKIRFDVIVANDILCYLSNSELAIFFKHIHELLSVEGILIVNVPAFHAFSGMHDLAVGIKQRFTLTDFDKFINEKKYKIIRAKYWPFLLSPLIYSTRLSQRINLKIKKNKKIQSDVKMFHQFINKILLNICKFEQKYLTRFIPFGSSLFFTVRKTK